MKEKVWKHYSHLELEGAEIFFCYYFCQSPEEPWYETDNCEFYLDEEERIYLSTGVDQCTNIMVSMLHDQGILNTNELKNTAQFHVSAWMYHKRNFSDNEEMPHQWYTKNLMLIRSFEIWGELTMQQIQAGLLLNQTGTRIFNGKVGGLNKKALEKIDGKCRIKDVDRAESLVRNFLPEEGRKTARGRARRMKEKRNG